MYQGAGAGKRSYLVAAAPTPVAAGALPMWTRGLGAAHGCLPSTAHGHADPLAPSRRGQRSRHKNFCARRRKCRPKKYKKGGYLQCRACDEKQTMKSTR
jgi:hypothetical protein